MPIVDTFDRIVPNYELAPDLQNIEILRVVVRENLTEVVRITDFVSFATSA